MMRYRIRQALLRLNIDSSSSTPKKEGEEKVISGGSSNDDTINIANATTDYFLSLIENIFGYKEDIVREVINNGTILP
jgi:hypothetical protein